MRQILNALPCNDTRFEDAGEDDILQFNKYDNNNHNETTYKCMGNWR